MISRVGINPNLTNWENEAILRMRIDKLVYFVSEPNILISLRL